MKRRMLVLALLALAGAACAADDGKALFESRCGTCHDLARSLSASKDAAGWKFTVDRMKARAKGAISDDEAAKILDYLVKTLPAK